MDKKIAGLLNLARKTFAVIVAATSSLISSEAKGQLQNQSFDNDDNKLNYESSNKRILKPKLVLKLNMNNPENSLLAFHASHSSHASHASHASHSSHYSSSSSSSYDYPTTPTYTPTYSHPAVPDNTITKSATASHPHKLLKVGTSNTPTQKIIRTLYKGCEGKDVEELQELLVILEPSLTINVSGYFGDQTENAVKKFQRDNELKPDGRVGIKTLNFMKKKKNGF